MGSLSMQGSGHRGLPWLLFGENPFLFSSHHTPLGTSFQVLRGVLYGDKKKEKDGREGKEERRRRGGREGRNEGFSTPRNMENFKVAPGAGCENSQVGCVGLERRVWVAAGIGREQVLG